jgi:peptide/nickel transport system substrate-binding protein
MSNNYWDKVLNRRLTRRRAVAATGATAAAAAFLAACGGDDDSGGSTTAPTTASGGTTPAAGATTAPAAAKPKVGGALIWQGYGDPGGGLELIKARNAGVNQMASLTHDALLHFGYGTPDYPGISNDVIPSMAVALPEITPDKLTITFKVVEGAKFQNGDPVTAEDFKWTYDTLAFADESANKGDFKWLDSVEAPDATTLVLHTNQVNADIMQTLAGKNLAGVLSQKFQESAEAENSLMGSGPFEFVEYNPPTDIKYKRFAGYWNSANAGWFDTIDRLGTSDSEKKVADIIAKQVHVTYWFPAEERERIKAARSDLLTFQYPRAGSGQVYIRTDVAPWSDKRVRQALSMGYDRQVSIDTVTDGEGQADQQLSRSGTAWGFRGPEDLPRADLYELNVAEAMKLLSAANVTLPLKADLPTWNATVIGQKFVDEITLITTQWRTNGILDANLLEETFGQFGPRFTGTYDSLQWGPNTTATQPDLGIQIYKKYYAGGKVPVAPTLNITYVNNPQIDDLVTKQLQEFDTEARKAVFKQLEDVLCEEMLHVSGVTGQLCYFIDPSVKNAQMPRDAYNGSTAWMKYWYFGDA